MPAVSLSNRPDFGPELLASVRQLLEVEPDRSLNTERAFTWRPTGLAQRVSVAPQRLASGGPTVTVHIETDLLRDVPDRRDTSVALGLLNRTASVSALVWRPATRRVSLHASVEVTEHTFHRNGFDDLAAMVAILQASEAEHRVTPVARAIEGAEVAATIDPVSGSRDQPPPALKHLATWSNLGEQPSRFTPLGGLEEVARILQWTDLRRSEDGLYGRFTYTGDDGTERSVMLGVFLGPEHPAFGHGAHLEMYLPAPGSPEVIDALNRLQADHPFDVHGYGAWCLDEWLRYELFLPNAFAQRGVLESAALSMYSRTEQAYPLLAADQGTSVSIVH